MPADSAILEEAKKPNQIPDVPNYSDDERTYLGALQRKLERSRDDREAPQDNLDGMTYSQWWEFNEKGGNTYIEPKKNREDSNYQSGTIRRKIFNFLAEVLKLDWFADVTAFDQADLENRSLGNALEDRIAKANEMDNDDEKRMLRFYEMFKQGDVFVEKVWDEKFIKEKKLAGNAFDGRIEGVSWTTKLKRKFARPTTKIISGLNVYLGNIRQYDFGSQPYVFTVDILDYAEAKAMYEKWERWDYVSKTLKEFFPDKERTMLYNNWRLLSFQKDKVERIRFQDKDNNEFAMILNGVLMTPVGLPLPWGYDDYNIAQQHLKPISPHFAYGSSLVKELRNNVLIADDMIRLMHLIERQRLEPARFNLTGRNVSRRVFLPGSITAGIDPKQLPLADERAVQGLGTSEFNFVNMLLDNVDKNSVGPIPAGQAPKGDPTATEVLAITKASQTMLSTILLACSLLEWKLSWLTLWTLLAKDFNKLDTRVNDAKQELESVYRVSGVSIPIDGKGMGRRITVPMDGELPGPDQIKAMEDNMETQTGVPHRFIFLNPQAVQSSKNVWQITIRPKPKANDEVSKLMFERMVRSALEFFGPDVNVKDLESEFAVAWDRDPKKLFSQGANMAAQQIPGQKNANVAKSVTLPPTQPMQ